VYEKLILEIPEIRFLEVPINGSLGVFNCNAFIEKPDVQTCQMYRVARCTELPDVQSCQMYRVAREWKVKTIFATVLYTKV